MEDFKKIFKDSIVTTIVISSLISALVGGAFGYYSASTWSQSGPVPLSQYFRTKSEKAAVSEESQVVSVVKKASPAVVSIVATKDLTHVEQQGIYNPFEQFCKDPFFKQVLGPQCDVQSQPPKTRTEKTQVSAGSGFIISSDGLILTNKHVVNVSGADYTVITGDNKKYPAKVLARDPVQDVALVKITVAGMPYLNLGDSSKIEIGQTVIAIGNALGQFSNSVSKGVISGLSRSITANEGGGSSEKLDQVVQTDAAINPGNSGGPLLNLYGEVIGINTAIAQGAQNIGFAIPISQAERDVNQFRKIGKVSYPFLGIRYLLINDEIKQKNSLSVNYGALVTRGETQADLAVTPGSPADKAGIQENDIILEINGRKITPENDLAKTVQTMSVGSTINLRVLSKGQEKTVSITLEERK